MGLGARGIGLGGSWVVPADDPTAIVWNPAGLAQIRGSEALVHVDRRYSFGYVGASHFVPRFGSLGLALSGATVSRRYRERWTGAWGFSLSSEVSIGAQANWTREGPKDFTTFGASLLFVPFQRRDRFNGLEPEEPLLLGASVQNLALGAGESKPALLLGVMAKPVGRMWRLATGFHARSGNSSFHLGAELEPLPNVQLRGGLRDGHFDTFALGGRFRYRYLRMDLAYSFELHRTVASFTFTLGDNPKTVADRCFRRGTEEVKEGRFRDALRSFRRAVAYDPSRDEAAQAIRLLQAKAQEQHKKIDSLLTEARALEKKQWYISATLNYLRVLEMDPNHRRAKRRVQILKPKVDIFVDRLYQGGVNLFEGGDYLKAREVFGKILLLRGGHPGSLAYMARLDTLLRQKAEEYFFRGLGYYSQKNWERAQQDLAQALLFDGQNDEARRYLEKTREELNHVRERVHALITEGEALEKKGDGLTAYLRYREAQTLDRGNEELRLRVQRLQPAVESFVEKQLAQGEVFYRSGQLRQAQEAFEKVLEIIPQHQTASRYRNLIQEKLTYATNRSYIEGLDRLEAGRWEEALDAFEQVLQANPRHAGARQKKRQVLALLSRERIIEKGKAAYLRGDYLGAMETFQEVLEQYPNDRSALDYIERCQRQLNVLVDDLFKQGLSYYTQEQYALALREWDRVLEINPNHKGSQEYKRRAQERLRALQALKR